MAGKTKKQAAEAAPVVLVDLVPGQVVMVKDGPKKGHAGRVRGMVNERGNVDVLILGAVHRLNVKNLAVEF